MCTLLGTTHPSLVLSANPAVANSPDTTNSVAPSASSIDKVTWIGPTAALWYFQYFWDGRPGGLSVFS